MNIDREFIIAVFIVATFLLFLRLQCINYKPLDPQKIIEQKGYNIIEVKLFCKKAHLNVDEFINDQQMQKHFENWINGVPDYFNQVIFSNKNIDNNGNFVNGYVTGRMLRI